MPSQATTHPSPGTAPDRAMSRSHNLPSSARLNHTINRNSYRQTRLALFPVTNAGIPAPVATRNLSSTQTAGRQGIFQPPTSGRNRTQSDPEPQFEGVFALVSGRLKS
jgi:hypothetical protein